METILRVLRGGTRNQSTADYERNQLFLYGNRKQTAIFNNNIGDALTAESGLLVVRDVDNPSKIILATWDLLADPDPINTLGDIIGILDIDGEVVMADTDDVNACYAISGDIDVSQLVFPEGVTLDTVVGNKVLKDILTGLGFVLFNVTENSKFDN
jgi:hypothetical protein